FANGQRIRQIEPTPKPKNLDVFDFASPNHIVLVNETAKEKVIQLVEIETGKVVWTKPTPEDFIPETVALSAGRKYFGFLAKNRLYVHETVSGKAAGTLDGPEGRGAALAFSPDGKEIAGLYFEAPGGRIVAWDVEKGEIVV